MEKKNYIKSKDIIPNTHFFVYGGQKYPIKFDYFKYASKYFETHQDEIMNKQDIDLLEGESSRKSFLSSDNINDFINFVQCKQIELDSKNVVELNYLSTKYDVSSLQEITNKYIIEHESDVVIDIIIEHQDEDEFNTSRYESMIAQHIDKYINDDRLHRINIPIIHRILNEYMTKYYKGENDEDGKTYGDIQEFLLKCVDKRGRSASVLYEQIKFGFGEHKYLHRLINEYSERFDFEYVGQSIASAMKHQMKEMNRIKLKKDELERSLSKRNSEIAQVTKDKEKIEQENYKLQQEKQLKEIEYKREIEKQKLIESETIKKYEQTISEIQTENIKIKDKYDKEEKINNELNSKNEQLQRLISQKDAEHLKEMKTQKQIFTQQIAQAQNQREISCSNGIFKYLFDKHKTNPIQIGLISISGNSINESWVENLPNIIDPTFNDYWLPEEHENSYFKIDFKKFSVKIEKYYLRLGNGWGDFIFNNWLLTGTTEDGKQITLDEVKNCKEITKKHPSTTISIQTNQYVVSITLTIKGKNNNGNFMYDVRNIELYGYLKEK